MRRSLSEFEKVDLNGIELEHVTCDLCNGEDTTVVFVGEDYRFGRKGSFTVVKCRSCGLIYLNPRPTINSISKLYADDYIESSRLSSVGSSFKRRLRHSMYSWRAYYFREMPAGKKVLDVGCGDGRLLEVLRDRGCTAFGVDISPMAVSACRHKGFDVVLGTVESARFASESFDVVIMSQILEHVPSPRATLNEVWRILRSNGAAYVYCPSAESYLARMFGRYWHGWHIPFHSFAFTIHTLSKLARQCGFVADIDTITPVGWLGVSLKGLIYGRKGRSVEKGRILDSLLFNALVFPVVRVTDLLLPGRGDCLRALLRKRNL